MIGISDKQGNMLAFIRNFVRQNGFPPTREEIRSGLNISTKSLVNYHLTALENAALLRRIPNTPRGIRLAGGLANGPKLAQAQKNGDTPLSESEVLELTYDMVTNDSNLFALKAKGDTIIDAQTSQGDVVILERQTQVENGDIAAVRLLDRNSTKIKRYYRENGHVRLESTQTAARPMLLDPDTVEVQGKVVAVIRQLN